MDDGITQCHEQVCDLDHMWMLHVQFVYCQVKVLCLYCWKISDFEGRPEKEFHLVPQQTISWYS